MSSFLVNLWESIFTPGPTPTLLIATNATFGALQLLLLVLLVTTASIHFAILSVLCAGLWYSINWFAREVQAAKTAEDAEAEGKKQQNARQTSPDPTGSDTETEADPVVATGANPTATTPDPGMQRRKPPAPQPGQAPMPPPTAPGAPTASRPAPPPPSAAPATVTAAAAPSSLHLQPNPPTSSPGLDGSQDLGRRRRSLGESSGYVSTDSEWEKVSDQEGK